MARRPSLMLGVALALFCAERTGRADRSFDAALAAPALDPYGMVVVERAATPQRHEFGGSVTFGWARNPFHPAWSDPQNGLLVSRFDLIQHQLTVDLGFYFGLWDFLSIAASLPVGVNFYDGAAVGEPSVPQPPSATNPTGAPGTSGLYNNQPRQNVAISQSGARDPRLSVKARFYGGRLFEIGAIVEVTVPLGDSAGFLGEKGATLRPRLLSGLRLGRVNLALSVGGIVRESAEFYDPYDAALLRFQTSHELTWGAGLSVLLHPLLSAGVEGFGTIPLAGDAVSATAGLLATLYVRPAEKWRLILSGGSGIVPDGVRNAEGRLLLGLSYSLSPRPGGLK